MSNIELSKLPELSRTLIENSDNGILIFDKNMKVEYVNNQLCQLLKLDVKDLLFIDFRSILNNSEKLLFEEKLFNFKNEKDSNSSFEFTIKEKNKVFDLKFLKYSERGEYTKTISRFCDITEKKIIENEKLQSEMRFRSIVEHSYLGITILDLNYKMEYVNNQFCKIINSKRDNILGNDFRNYLSEEFIDLFENSNFHNNQILDIPSEKEVILFINNNKKIYVKLSTSKIIEKNSKNIIVQVLDITEKVKNEKLQKVILNISQAVNEVESLYTFLRTVRSELSNIIDTKNFYVAIYNSFSDTYTFPYHVDEFDKINEFTQLELKGSLTDYARRNNKATLVNKETNKKLEQKGEIKGTVGEYSCIWIGAPLIVENDVVGLIGLQNYYNEKAYDYDDLELLKIVSEKVSSAIWKMKITDQIKRSEKRYKEFINKSSEGIFRIDFNPPIELGISKEKLLKKVFELGIFAECNEAFCKLYGLNSSSEIIGSNIDELLNRRINGFDKFAFKDFTDYYTIEDVETQITNSDGEKFNMLTSCSGVIKDNCLHNIWGINKDITKRKKLQSAVQQIAEGISSSIGGSFFNSLVNFLGETVKVDYAYIGRLSEDGKSVNALAFWEKNKFFERENYCLKNSPCEVVVKSKKPVFLENVCEKFPKDESLINKSIASYLGKSLINSEGKTIGLIVILNEEKFEDLEFTKSVLEIFATRSSAEIERLQYVKEIVHAKEEAERSNNLKTDFLAQMSHEIRTPVNTILSFSSLIKESLESRLEDDLKDSFEIIESGGRRLIRTIDLILDVSQIQTGNLTISPAKINLTKILRGLISEHKNFAAQNNLDLKLKCNSNDVIIFKDNYSITQIFANLIDNAIKYTNQGNVEVIIEESKDEAIVKVSDTGVGMSDDFITKIFEPFSQEETGYTRTFEGNGLGLTLVRNYCELNDAKISVTSKKNNGTSFIVKFNLE